MKKYEQLSEHDKKLCSKVVQVFNGKNATNINWTEAESLAAQIEDEDWNLIWNRSILNRTFFEFLQRSK